MKRNVKNNNNLVPNTLQKVLADLMNRQKDGVITLAQFIRKCPANLRDGALEFLRNVESGDFIEGRRGHPSRFVFGEALDKWIHQEEIRREWRIRNGKNPETGGPLNPGASRGRGRPVGSKNQNSTPVRGGSVKKMSLSVNVGGQKTTIPLEMEVIHHN